MTLAGRISLIFRNSHSQPASRRMRKKPCDCHYIPQEHYQTHTPATRHTWVFVRLQVMSERHCLCPQRLHSCKTETGAVLTQYDGGKRKARLKQWEQAPLLCCSGSFSLVSQRKDSDANRTLYLGQKEINAKVIFKTKIQQLGGTEEEEVFSIHIVPAAFFGACLSKDVIRGNEVQNFMYKR